MMKTIAVDVLPDDGFLDILLLAVKEYYILDERLFDETIVDSHEKIRDIISQKISSIMDVNPDFRDPKNILLKEMMSAEFVDFYDISYLQFPNYVFKIVLNTSEKDYTKQSSSIFLVISLLTKFYTVFYEENMNFIGLHDLWPSCEVNLLSEVNFNFDAEGAFFQKLKNIAQQVFPDYNFISHTVLLSYTIKIGTPYGQFAKRDATLYEYLFDMGYAYRNTVLAQSLSFKQSLD